MTSDVCICCGAKWEDGKGFIEPHRYPCANKRYGWNFTKSSRAILTDKENYAVDETLDLSNTLETLRWHALGGGPELHPSMTRERSLALYTEILRANASIPEWDGQQAEDLEVSNQYLRFMYKLDALMDEVRKIQGAAK